MNREDIEMALRERVIHQVKFEKHGDQVTGHLVQISPVRFSDGARGTRFKVKVEGVMCVFLGNHMLNDLISSADLGRLVKVEYTDDQDTRNGKMKLFRVFIDDEDVLPGFGVVPATMPSGVVESSNPEPLGVSGGDIPW